jgi:glycosyltransferase involved in cell wall biosynthesis
VIRHIAGYLSASGPGVEHHVVLPPVPAGAILASGAPYDPAAERRIVASGGVIHRIDMRRSPGHPANAAAVVRLRRLIRSVAPNVVHGHSSVGGALARIAGAACGLPVVYTPNGLAPGRFYRTVERGLGRLTDRWIAVSCSEAELARQLRLVPADRIVTIPNGIDLTAGPSGRSLRSELGLADGTPLVGTVARLVDQKAPDHFVRACAEIGRHRPDVHFLLIGAGPLQALVDEEVARAGIGPRWHHLSSFPDAAGVIDQLEVFLLLSRFEGGPYTPLEAMRAGTPVVLSDVVGNRDAVEPGISGVVVPFGDTGAAARAALDLLADPARRRTMAAAARQRLADRFDLRRGAARLVEVYERVAGSDQRPAPPGIPGEGGAVRRSTLRLPRPRAGSSVQPPDASASQ